MLGEEGGGGVNAAAVIGKHRRLRAVLTVWAMNKLIRSLDHSASVITCCKEGGNISATVLAHIVARKTSVTQE